MNIEDIILHDPLTTDAAQFRATYTRCLILEPNGMLVCQYRGPEFKTFPNQICAFGGKIEADESPDEGMCRELQEAIGQSPSPTDLQYVEALSEAQTQHKDLIYTFFWKSPTLLHQCNEGQFIRFEYPEDALEDTRLLPDTRWLLQKCNDLNWIHL